MSYIFDGNPIASSESPRKPICSKENLLRYLQEQNLLRKTAFLALLSAWKVQAFFLKETDYI